MYTLNAFQPNSIQYDWIGGWKLGSGDKHLAGDFDGNGKDDVFIRSPQYAGLLTYNGSGFQPNSIQWRQQFQFDWLPPLPNLTDLVQQLQPLGTFVFSNFFTFFSNSVAAILQLLFVLVLAMMMLVNPQPYRQGEKKPKYTELSKRLTQIKKTTEKVWLTEVSSIPLQQSLRDLETAYSNFFASCNGERKGKKVKPPKFKKRKSQQSARFTDNGFTVNQHHVTLAKIGDLKVVWSRPLPSKPSSVTVIKDAADRYFLSFVVEIRPETTETIK